jgi:HEAT repeat protein
MLRYLTVAAMLLVWTGTGCSNKAERTKSAGDRSAADGATSSMAASRDKREATRTEGVTKSDLNEPARDGTDTPAVKPGADVAPGAGGSANSSTAPAEQLDPAVMSTVQPLLVQMSSDASIERQAAAASLDEMGAAAMPYVTAALRNGSEAEKRGAAAFLIGRVTRSDDATLAALIEALGAADDALRHSALQAVEKLPEGQLCRALATLTELAKNPKEDAAYRVRAVRAIAKLGAAGRDAVADLLQLARDDSAPDLQRSAFDAIAKVATPEASETFFLEVLKSNSQKDLRRLAATRLVQEAMSPQSVVGLIGAFSDAEADVRNEARAALLAIGRPAVPQLIQALEDPAVQIRRHVVVTLGQLNTLAVEAVPALKQRLQDADPQVRALTAASLRLIQSQ